MAEPIYAATLEPNAIQDLADLLFDAQVCNRDGDYFIPVG